MKLPQRLRVLIVFLPLLLGGWLFQNMSLPKPQTASAAGQAAPDFSLADQSGHAFRLADQRGHRVLLIFYRGYW